MEYQRLTSVFDSDYRSFDEGVKHVDEGFAKAEKRAQDSVSRFDRISADIGKTLGKGIRLGLGDVGVAVDALTNITSGALKSIPVVGTGLAAAFDEAQGAMKSAVDEGFRYDDMMKRNRISLSLIARGANEAGRELAGLRGISSSSEFGISALVASARQLQLMQDNARDVVPEIRAIADAAAALDVGNSGLEAMADLLARIAETGKVSTREVRALVRLGVPAFDILGEAAGLSKSRTKRLLDSGRVSANDFIDILLGDFQKRYKGAAAQMADTISVQNAKLASGMAALKGVAFQNLYDSTVRSEKDINKLIRGPQAGQVAAGLNAGAAPITGLINLSLKALESGDLYGGALKAGASVTEGLRKGITDNAGAAAGAAKDMGLGALQSVKDALGIESPSKAFMEVGQMAGVGFALGLREVLKRLSKEHGGDLRKYLDELSKDPQIQAWFEMIRRVEGGQPDVMAGGRHVQSGPRHPGEIIPRSEWFRGSQGPSSAAGNWQTTLSNWRVLSPALGLNNFSDVNQQLIAALALFAGRGGDRALLSGDMRGALRASADWAATPLSHLPGGKPKTVDEFISGYQALLGRGANLPPMPVRVVSGDLTGGLGQFVDRPDPNANAPVLSGLQPIAETFDTVVGKTKIWKQELIPLKVSLDDVAKDGDQIAEAYERAASKLRGVRGELLQLGITSKDIGDSFESQFSSAFDHIGEQGHSFARDLALGMLQDIRHNVGVGIAGELRDAIFGTQDGSKGGLWGGIGKLLGGGGGAQTQSTAAVTVNTTATQANTFAIQNLTAQMAFNGGGFMPGLKAARGDVSTHEGLHALGSDGSASELKETNSTLHELSHSLGDVKTGIGNVSTTIQMTGNNTVNKLDQLGVFVQQLIPARMPWWGQVLVGALGMVGQGIVNGLMGGGGGFNPNEGPAQPRPTSPPVLKRARGGPIPSWTPFVAAEPGAGGAETLLTGDKAFVIDRPGHVLNHNETRQLFQTNSTTNNMFPREVKIVHSGHVTYKEDWGDRVRREKTSYSSRPSSRQIARALADFIEHGIR